jgi:hypothetical protein
METTLTPHRWPDNYRLELRSQLCDNVTYGSIATTGVGVKRRKSTGAQAVAADADRLRR